jgi:hypothetical protein
VSAAPRGAWRTALDRSVLPSLGTEHWPTEVPTARVSTERDARRPYTGGCGRRRVARLGRHDALGASVHMCQPRRPF